MKAKVIGSTVYQGDKGVAIRVAMKLLEDNADIAVFLHPRATNMEVVRKELEACGLTKADLGKEVSNGKTVEVYPETLSNGATSWSITSFRADEEAVAELDALGL
jgi:3-deoxy-D-manno-octulosonic-acid transferase